MRRLTRHEPASVQDACRLLNKHGGDAQVYAGGTELLTLLKLGLVRCEHLIDLKGISGLDFINYDEVAGRLRIGGLVIHRDLERSKLVLDHFPVLAQVERDVANVRVRNVGTLAGNLCFADPYSDPGTLLSCFQSELVLQRGELRHVVPIDAFLVDAYTTSREDDEVLVEIRIPAPPPRSKVSYQTFRFYERPSANVAVMASLSEDAERVNELRVVVGAVPPTPIRLTAAEAVARNVEVGRVAEAVDEVSAGALENVEVFAETHGSPEYQRGLVRVLLRRALASIPGAA
jgi:carbon-monoxide dehydrogenase medium subunit